MSPLAGPAASGSRDHAEYATLWVGAFVTVGAGGGAIAVSIPGACAAAMGWVGSEGCNGFAGLLLSEQPAKGRTVASTNVWRYLISWGVYTRGCDLSVVGLEALRQSGYCLVEAR